MGTWCNSSGLWRRIDFIALPIDWAPGVACAWIVDSVFLAPGALQDHRVAAARVAIRSSRRQSQRPAPPWDRRLLRDPACAAALADRWLHVPDLPAEWDADTAKQQFTKLSRIIFADTCPKGAAAPRKEWVQPASLEALRSHGTIRASYYQAARSVKRLLSCIAFFAWADAARMPWWRGHGQRRTLAA